MATIPEGESPLADHDFVNIGEQNWYALRSEWREVPEDFDESKVVRVDPNSIDLNTVYSNLFKNEGTSRTPLSSAITALTQIWSESTS